MTQSDQCRRPAWKKVRICSRSKSCSNSMKVILPDALRPRSSWSIWKIDINISTCQDKLSQFCCKEKKTNGGRFKIDDLTWWILKEPIPHILATYLGCFSLSHMFFAGLLLLVVHGILDVEILITFGAFNCRLAKPESQFLGNPGNPHNGDESHSTQHILDHFSHDSYQSSRSTPQTGLGP